MTANKSGRIGIIARADLTGLGIQSRNWVRLLNPHKVIVIDSTPFNRNEQHFEWYEGYNCSVVDGFIQDQQIDQILDDIDILLTFEIPYNYNLFKVARDRGIKTILQNNWEFTDYLQRSYLPLPDALVNHSYWNLDVQQKMWPDISEYCPTPLFIEDYTSIYRQNFARVGKMRFLHVAGRKTHLDRKGTQDLLDAVKLIPADIEFELVIKAQNADVNIVGYADPRVTIDRRSPVDEKELYQDFDAMVLPRRYAGACLPMNEALASGLPVIMTDISPNNHVLPSFWLVPAEKKTSFMARTEIDVYSADHVILASKIAEFVALSYDTLDDYRNTARRIAVSQYSSESVKRKWCLLMDKIGL